MTPFTAETTNGRSETAPLSESDWHRILSVRRRRILLDALDDCPTPTDVDALAEAVEERENSLDTGSEGALQVAITLHHVHLPKLAELDVVEYDPETRRVESFRDVLIG